MQLVYYKILASVSVIKCLSLYHASFRTNDRKNAVVVCCRQFCVISGGLLCRKAFVHNADCGFAGPGNQRHDKADGAAMLECDGLGDTAAFIAEKSSPSG